MEENRAYQNFINWNSNTVIIYKSDVTSIGRRVDNGSNLVIDRAKAYKGQVTSKSVARVKKVLNGWLNVLVEGNRLKKTKKIRAVLVTLTLSSKQYYSGIQNDMMIKKKCLEPMLKWLQNNYDVRSYFWRAEAQENGNIHFHILTDRYINKEKLQAHWNKIQDRYDLLKDYKNKYGKTNPPSTHIRVYDLNNDSIDYLLKYLTKDNERRLIEGLQMRLSNTICHIKTMSQAIEKSSEIGLINELHEKSTWQHYDDFFMIFKFSFNVDNYFRFSENSPDVKKYYCMVFELMYVYDAPGYLLNLLNHLFTNIWKARYLINVYREKGLILDDFFLLCELYDVEY